MTTKSRSPDKAISKYLEVCQDRIPWRDGSHLHENLAQIMRLCKVRYRSSGRGFKYAKNWLFQFHWPYILYTNMTTENRCTVYTKSHVHSYVFQWVCVYLPFSFEAIWMFPCAFLYLIACFDVYTMPTFTNLMFSQRRINKRCWTWYLRHTSIHDVKIDINDKWIHVCYLFLALWVHCKAVENKG